MLQIDLQPLTAYQQGVVLDNQRYVIQYVWNQLNDFWTMSFIDSNGNLILSLKLVQFLDLTSQYRAYPTIPPGVFTIYDQTGSHESIDYNAWMSGDIVMLYIPYADAVAQGLR